MVTSEMDMGWVHPWVGLGESVLILLFLFFVSRPNC